MDTPVFTIFSVPKPFRGHIQTIQENAIRSWTRLGTDHEVILLGAEEGTAEVAERLRVRHEQGIPLNDNGTPLVSGVFERAQRVATHDWLCYVNCDVILMSDLPRAVRRVAELGRSMLVSGRRWRLDVDRSLEFESGWEERLRSQVRANGLRDSLQCMDYFIFERGLFPDLQEFAVGRGRWDSHLPFRARARGALFVDASSSVMAVHQNHEFAHPEGKAGLRHSPEGVRNGELAGKQRCTLGDARHKLTSRGLRRAIDHDRLRWWLWANRDRAYVGFPVRKLVERHKIGVKRALVR